jgi:molybdopterin/thiamine biosynthesis adenylyltransferase
MDGLHEFLREQSADSLLPLRSETAAAARFGLSFAQVEEIALTLGLLPLRYQRNRQAISIGDQLTLFRSRVAVLGCGGIGGYVIEELARLGVGTLTAIDPDVFEEHNLNRQMLSSPNYVGRPKVELAAARVAEINPAVTLLAVQKPFTCDNGTVLLQRNHVVVDALDSISTRLVLARTCAQLNIPLVHGAIAGWYGQITTQFPGDHTMEALYGRWAEGKGVEQRLGNPSFTPALVASMEAAEVCKIILGKGKPLQNRVISVNLLEMTFEEMAFKCHENKVHV